MPKDNHPFCFLFASRIYVFAVLLAAPFLSHAEDVRLRAMKAMHRNLFTQHEICVLRGRMALLPEPAKSAESVSDCTSEGRGEVEQINADLGRLIKGKAAQSALADWRIKWLETFDAADVQTNDTSELYLRRVTDALKRADKVSQKLQATVIKSPL